MDYVSEWLFGPTGPNGNNTQNTVVKKKPSSKTTSIVKSSTKRKSSTSDEDDDEAKRNDYNIFCRRCEEPVNREDAGRAVLAGGHVYHSLHFTCLLCSLSVLDGYFSHPSLPDDIVCCDCHQRMSNPPCAGCDLPLRGTACRAQDRLWHRECIRCTACQQIISKDYCDLNGRIFHEGCLMMRLHRVSKEPVIADK